MLKTTRQITLNGQSVVNDQVIVTFNATIPSETGVGSTNQYVQNAQLYDANKTQVRRDAAEFQAMVYDVEDEMAAEVPVEPTA